MQMLGKLKNQIMGRSPAEPQGVKRKASKSSELISKLEVLKFSIPVAVTHLQISFQALSDTLSGSPVPIEVSALEDLSAININVNEIKNRVLPEKLLKESIETNLRKIARYSKKRPLNEKIGFVSNLLGTSQDIGRSNTVRTLVPLLKIIVTDVDEIKALLLKQIPSFAKYISERDEGYTSICTQIIPVIEKLIMDLNTEISEEASAVLVSLSQLLSEEDRGTYILTFVLKLSHDYENEDSRIASVKLLNILAPVLGKVLCEQFVAFEIMNFADDPNSSIKRATTHNFVKVCDTVDLDFFLSKLLPVFKKLSVDKEWEVRRAAAEILVDISQVCPLESRMTEMVGAFQKLMKDTSRFVQMSAYYQIGPFIATLEGSDIPKSLIEYFTALSNSKLNIGNDDAAYHCAFHFPGVLATVGPQKWISLANTYHKLFKSPSIRVKKTLACSISKIAEFVGPDLAKEELIDIVKRMLEDKDKGQILMGCLRNVHEFIGALREEDRLQFLDILRSILEDSNLKWRIRDTIASHIEDYAQIFPVKYVFQQICPWTMTLCKDKVAEVRIHAAQQVYSLVGKMYESKPNFQTLCTKLIQFAQSDTYIERQTFVYMCGPLISYHPKIFTENLLEGFLETVRDPVHSVKISVSTMLRDYIETNNAEQKEIIRGIKSVSSEMTAEMQWTLTSDKGSESFVSSSISEEDYVMDNEAANIVLDPADVDSDEEDNKMKIVSAERFSKIKIDEIDENLGVPIAQASHKEEDEEHLEFS